MNPRELRMNVYNSSKIGHANVSFYEDGQHVYTIGANILRNVPQLAVPRFAPFQRDDGIYRDESADHLAAIVEGTVISAGVPVTDLEYEELLSQARELEGQTFNYSVFTEACVELVERFYEEAGHPGEFGDLYPEEARTGSLVWQRVPITDTSIISTWPDNVPYYRPPALLLPDPPSLPPPPIFGDLPPAPATPEEARMLANAAGAADGAATDGTDARPEDSGRAHIDAGPDDGIPELTFGITTDTAEERWAAAESLTFGADLAGTDVGAPSQGRFGHTDLDDARVGSEGTGEKQDAGTERSATLPEATAAGRPEIGPNDGDAGLTFGVAGDVPEERWAAAGDLAFGAGLAGVDIASMPFTSLGAEAGASSAEAASIFDPSAAAASDAADAGNRGTDSVAIDAPPDLVRDAPEPGPEGVGTPEQDQSIGAQAESDDGMPSPERPEITVAEPAADTDRTAPTVDADRLSAAIDGGAWYEITSFGEDAEPLATGVETPAIVTGSDAGSGPEKPTIATAANASSVEFAGVADLLDHPSAVSETSAGEAIDLIAGTTDPIPAIDQESALADDISFDAPIEIGEVEAPVEPQPALPATAAPSRDSDSTTFARRDDDDDDDGSAADRDDASGPKSSSSDGGFASGETQRTEGSRDFGVADEFDFGPSPSTELSFGDGYGGASSIDTATFSEPNLSFGDFDTGSSYDVGYDMGTTSFDDGYSFF